MTEPIPPGERRELRSVVRQQFRVLRTEVKQRELELKAEAERRLMERYRDEDKAIDDLNWRITEIAREAQRQIDDLMKEHSDAADGGKWGRHDGRLSANGVSRKTEDRTQLHRALMAGINEQVRQASLALDRQEADLLRALSMETLESSAARAFLERIPTVGELVPSARLREIESAFDKDGDPR
jgi:hypothetical protein